MKCECHVANHQAGGLVHFSWMHVHDDIYSHRENNSKYYQLISVNKQCGIVHVKNNRLSMRRKTGLFSFNCTKDHCVVPVHIGKLMVKYQSFEIPEYHTWLLAINNNEDFPEREVLIVGRFQ